MKIFAINRIAGVVMLMAGINSGILAQDYNDAAMTYNKGVAKFTTDIDSAIILFEDCLKICNLVGDTTEDIRFKVVQVLPDLYFQKAYNLLAIDKKVDESLQASRKSLAVAQKYEDALTVEKTQKLMIQAYSTMGSTYFSSNENEKALSAFDSVLAINPDHLASIYNKSLTYKKMNDPSKYGETIDIYLEKLKVQGDTTKYAQVSKTALEYFRSLASKANKENILADALNLLNTASKYGTDKDVYYYYADIYNKQKKFADAADNAQKGLDMETGAPEAKAKYYYQLGVAQSGKGETAKACESFKNSMYGPFVDASKAQRTNLKCQ
jgi:tetratricopeptide (TPR) repeat protein